MASVSWDYHSYRHKVRYQVQEGRKAFRKLPPLHLVHRTYAYDPSWYQLFGLMEAEQVLELLSRVSRMKHLQGIRLAQKPENPPPVLTDEERYRRRKQKKRIMRENRIQRHHMIPDSRGGSKEKQNMLRIKAGRHKAWHDLFDTDTWDEAIARLASVIERHKTLEQVA